MITNARLISLTTPAVADGNGGYTAGVETTFTGVRMAVDVPSYGELRSVEGRIKDPKAVAYLPLPLPGGYGPQEGGDIKFVVDKSVIEQSMRLAIVRPQTHGLSHYQCFLQGR